MPERIKIVIHPNRGGADRLTIEDAMSQVLDLFDLLGLENKSDDKIGWNLVSASANSPFTIEGEAYGVGGGPVEESARIIKASFSQALDGLASGHIPPQWAIGASNTIAKRVFKRNTNGIGRTDIHLDASGPKTFTPKLAKTVEWLLSKPIEVEQVDRSRTEIGSIEAMILEVGTFYNRPSIKVRERLTESELWCIIPEDISEEIASSTSFSDVWENRRVLIRGTITYDFNGKINRVYVRNIKRIEPVVADMHDIVDKEFTGGLSPEDYLNRFREGGLG